MNLNFDAMHELPITEQIIKIAQRQATNAQASRIEKIILVVGEQSGFVGESIQMYFDIISGGTMCEGAELVINPIKPKLRCATCGAFFLRKPFSFQCGECGGEGAPTEIGKEFYIESIIVNRVSHTMSTGLAVRHGSRTLQRRVSRRVGVPSPTGKTRKNP